MFYLKLNKSLRHLHIDKVHKNNFNKDIFMLKIWVNSPQFRNLLEESSSEIPAQWIYQSLRKHAYSNILKILSQNMKIFR